MQLQKDKTVSYHRIHFHENSMFASLPRSRYKWRHRKPDTSIGYKGDYLFVCSKQSLCLTFQNHCITICLSWYSPL